LIVKERELPIKLLFYEAVLHRLSDHHPSRDWIHANMLRGRAGYKGERNSDYFLNLLIDDHINILHNIRLPHKKTFFQIDTLVLSPKFALIIEVKNISGKLFFDRTFKQLIRTHANKQEGFSDPIGQAKRHCLQFKYWLSKNHITVPIEWVVVVGKPSSIIETEPEWKEISKNLCHAENIFEKVEELNVKYQTPKLDQECLDNLSSTILNQHVPEAKPYIEEFNIAKSDIRTGVQCPFCQALPMSRRKGTWHCQNCKKNSKVAHYEAIIDYSLLFSSLISNDQFRKFFHVPSRYAAIRLIKSLNLQPVGSKKGTKYMIPDRLCNQKQLRPQQIQARAQQN
jgi:ribosomal protein L37AE/L43A